MEEELEQAAQELADYGDGETGQLLKALHGVENLLTKSGTLGKSPPETRKKNNNPRAHEEDAPEAESLAHDDDAGADDGEGESEPEVDDQHTTPASKGNKTTHVNGKHQAKQTFNDGVHKKSQGAAATNDSSPDALDQQLLKSLLTDDDGNASPVGEFIEVSDVLMAFTDTLGQMAKSLSSDISQVKLTQDESLALAKGMARAIVKLAGENAALNTRLDALERQTIPLAFPGQTHSIAKSMPVGDGGTPAIDYAKLEKSRVSAAINATFELGLMTPDQYKRSATTIDSRGVQAALEVLPVDVRAIVAKAVTGTGQ